MSYIIEVSGKQYKANYGDKIILDRVNASVGDVIDLKVIADIANLKFSEFVIKGKVESHTKGKKIVVFKKIRRHGYENKKGHRSLLTVVRVVKDENN